MLNIVCLTFITVMKSFISITLLFASLLIHAQANFLISAHRGNSSEAPENTISAFQSAIDVGADYFECDVRRTKDQVLVTLHDATLNRTTDVTGRLNTYNYKQLSTIDAGYPDRFGNQFQGERIPSLLDVLQLAKNKIKVEIELKEDGLVSDIVTMVEQLDMVDQVSIISFDLDHLEQVKMLNPQIDVKYLLGFFWWTRQMNQARSIGAEFIGPYGVASARRVRQAEDRGLGIISYTINSESDILRAIQNGQAGIATDFPERAVQLRNQNRKTGSSLVKTTTNVKVEAELTEKAIPHKNVPFSVFIYPNPVRHRFHLNSPAHIEANVRLHSTSGTMIHDFGRQSIGSNKPIYLPDSISKGVYILIVNNGVDSLHQKIVIE